MASSRWKWWIAKPAVFLACLAPITLLLYRAFADQLSANPVSDITNETGVWTLRFILTTLSNTPIRRLTGWQSVIRFRRMTGLFAFFYGILHFTTYIWLDQALDIHEIVKDLPKRPFITAGFTAFVLMIPLALTSTKRWIGRLGGKRWTMLHRLIYISAVAAVVHYYWLVKLDTTNPVRYGMVVALLLGFRAWQAIRLRAPNKLAQVSETTSFRS